MALLWLPVAGVSGVVVALASTWAVAVAVMVVWGVSYQGVVLNSMTYRQQVTPEPLLGRVNTAGRMLSFGVGWTGGALVASALAGLVGLRPALVAVVSVGLLAAVFGWCSPLRTLDREPVEGATADGDGATASGPPWSGGGAPPRTASSTGSDVRR